MGYGSRGLISFLKTLCDLDILSNSYSCSFANNSKRLIKAPLDAPITF
jgi:hypothetical protein